MRALLHASPGRCVFGPRQQRPLARPRSVATMASAAASGVALNGGVTLSPLVAGCWQLSERGLTAAQAVEALCAHASAGLMSVDTADIYGPSEQVVGQFVRAWAARGGRPAPVVCTKYVSPDLSAGAVRAGVARSLARLGLPAVDLVALHAWDFGAGGYVAAAQELTKLRAEGKIKAVGVTNFDVPRLTELLDAGVPVASNQVQYSLLDRRPESGGMVALCSRRGMKLLAYGSVAGGLLSDAWLGAPPPGRGALATSSLRMYAASLQAWSRGDWALFQELLRAMRAVADRHAASVANVATRYVLDTLGDGGGAAIVGVRGTRWLEDTARTNSFRRARSVGRVGRARPFSVDSTPVWFPKSFIHSDSRALNAGARLDAADLASLREVLARGAPAQGDCYDRERGYV